MKTKCRHADAYKAMIKPRCNVGGRVCDVCQEKWDAAKKSGSTVHGRRADFAVIDDIVA